MCSQKSICLSNKTPKLFTISTSSIVSSPILMLNVCMFFVHLFSPNTINSVLESLGIVYYQTSNSSLLYCIIQCSLSVLDTDERLWIYRFTYWDVIAVTMVVILRSFSHLSEGFYVLFIKPTAHFFTLELLHLLLYIVASSTQTIETTAWREVPAYCLVARSICHDPAYRTPPYILRGHSWK